MSPWPVLRLPWLALALAVGVLASEVTSVFATAPGVWWLAAVVLTLTAPWRGVTAARRASWLGLVVLLGAAVGAGARARVPTLPAGATADDRSEDEISGVVDGPVATTRWGSALRVRVDGGDARVWIMLDHRADVLPGDRVRASGRLREPRGYRNPGGVDRRVLAASRGVDLELRAAELAIVARGAELTPWRLASRWQRSASDWIAGRGGDPVGNAVVRGAVLGDRSAIAPAVDDAWRAAGVYHVLSVSGLHLAVVALLSFAALRRIVTLLGHRIEPTRTAALAAAGLAVLYTMVTGAEVATVRALVVALAVLVGAALGRRARAIDALGLAAFLIVAHTPAALRDPSFQLSFVATAALLVMRPRPVVIVEPSWRRRAVRGALRWLGRALAASAWVALITAPITAKHFHQVAVGGLVGNLVATPIIELVVIPAALLGLVVSHLHDGAGGLLVDTAVAVCGIVHDGIAWLASWTPTLAVPPPTTTQMVAFAGLAGAAILWRQRERYPWIPRPRAVIAALVAVSGATLVLASVWPQSAALRVTFLDVGQGDAAVVETPTGEVWLIDAGGLPYVPAGDDALAVASAPGQAIARFFATRGIDHIDVAVISHPHPDHYLGLVALAPRFPIREVWIAAPPASESLQHPPDEVLPGDAQSGKAVPGEAVPGEAVPDDVQPGEPRASARVPSFTTVGAALAARGTRIVYPRLGEARRAGALLRVYAPVYDPGSGALPHAAGDPVRSVNDDSLVVAVEYAGRRIAFLGDIETEGEFLLVTRDARHLRSDVVKVPHHGSGTSSGDDLVAASRPAIAVVSCGRNNRFGFPATDVVARWTGVGARVLRTDLHGAITVLVDADGTLEVETFDSD